jgi:NADPH:quinone reductase-like Zn-dependent oxidoreductase
MKAVRLHGRGGPDHLVYATGVIANELKWDATYQTKAGNPRALPIPGRDLSGVVEEVGPGVTTLVPGSEVYAMLDFGCDGAEAEYTIALPNELAPKPGTLDHVQAAAVPLSALTAWQALFEHANLGAGQTVLIHGAAGGVGVFAMQLARLAGAQVIATTSARNGDFLRELGATEVIDYTTTRFEEVVKRVDVVFDTVGGDTLQRSWQVVKPGGVLVSVVSPRPSADGAKGHDARFAWFVGTQSGATDPDWHVDRCRTHSTHYRDGAAPLRGAPGVRARSERAHMWQDCPACSGRIVLISMRDENTRI